MAEAEKTARPATPVDQLGPFYTKGSPNTAMLRGASDPGLALAVAGAVYNTRGEVDMLANSRRIMPGNHRLKIISW